MNPVEKRNVKKNNIIKKKKFQQNSINFSTTRQKKEQYENHRKIFKNLFERKPKL